MLKPFCYFVPYFQEILVLCSFAVCRFILLSSARLLNIPLGTKGDRSMYSMDRNVEIACSDVVM
jgi:hypothetical protein